MKKIIIYALLAASFSCAGTSWALDWFPASELGEEEISVIRSATGVWKIPEDIAEFGWDGKNLVLIMEDGTIGVYGSRSVSTKNINTAVNKSWDFPLVTPEVNYSEEIRKVTDRFINLWGGYPNGLTPEVVNMADETMGEYFNIISQNQSFIGSSEISMIALRGNRYFYRLENILLQNGRIDDLLNLYERYINETHEGGYMRDEDVPTDADKTLVASKLASSLVQYSGEYPLDLSKLANIKYFIRKGAPDLYQSLLDSKKIK